MDGYPITAGSMVSATVVNAPSLVDSTAINATSVVNTSSILAPSSVALTEINAPSKVQATNILASSFITTGQKGEQGPPGSGSDTIAIFLPNRDSVTIFAGMAVAMAPSGDGVVRASKVTTEDRRALGIAQTDAFVGIVFPTVVLGVLEVADWTFGTGASWLAPGGRLALGIDGMMTNAATATPGQFNQEVAKVSGPYTVIVNPSGLKIIN